MKKAVDTLRLILFLECNMSCSYCCNEQEQFSSQFKKMELGNIDFSKYENVCITGGEPFLNFKLLQTVITHIPASKRIYIYTNGIGIANSHILILSFFSNIKGFNIGLHSKNQLKFVNKRIESFFPVRFMVQDKYYDEMLRLYPARLNKENTKPWKLNDCNMPNEDWVLLDASVEGSKLLAETEKEWEINKRFDGRFLSE